MVGGSPNLAIWMILLVDWIVGFGKVIDFEVFLGLGYTLKYLYLKVFNRGKPSHLTFFGLIKSSI